MSTPVLRHEKLVFVVDDEPALADTQRWKARWWWVG